MANLPLSTKKLKKYFSFIHASPTSSQSSPFPLDEKISLVAPRPPVPPQQKSQNVTVITLSSLSRQTSRDPQSSASNTSLSFFRRRPSVRKSAPKGAPGGPRTSTSASRPSGSRPGSASASRPGSGTLNATASGSGSNGVAPSAFKGVEKGSRRHTFGEEDVGREKRKPRPLPPRGASTAAANTQTQSQGTVDVRPSESQVGKEVEHTPVQKVVDKGKQRDPHPELSPPPSPTLSSSSESPRRHHHQRNLSFPLDSHSPVHTEPPPARFGFRNLLLRSDGRVQGGDEDEDEDPLQPTPTSTPTPKPQDIPISIPTLTPEAKAQTPETKTQPRPLVAQQHTTAKSRPLPKVPPPSPPGGPPPSSISASATSHSSSSSSSTQGLDISAPTVAVAPNPTGTTDITAVRAALPDPRHAVPALRSSSPMASVSPRAAPPPSSSYAVVRRSPIVPLDFSQHPASGPASSLSHPPTSASTLGPLSEKGGHRRHEDHERAEKESEKKDGRGEGKRLLISSPSTGRLRGKRNQPLPRTPVSPPFSPPLVSPPLISPPPLVSPSPATLSHSVGQQSSTPLSEQGTFVQMQAQRGEEQGKMRGEQARRGEEMEGRGRGEEGNVQSSSSPLPPPPPRLAKEETATTTIRSGDGASMSTGKHSPPQSHQPQVEDRSQRSSTPVHRAQSPHAKEHRVRTTSTTKDSHTQGRQTSATTKVSQTHASSTAKASHTQASSQTNAPPQTQTTSSTKAPQTQITPSTKEAPQTPQPNSTTSKTPPTQAMSATERLLQQQMQRQKQREQLQTLLRQESESSSASDPLSKSSSRTAVPVPSAQSTSVSTTAAAAAPLPTTEGTETSPPVAEQVRKLQIGEPRRLRKGSLPTAVPGGPQPPRPPPKIFRSTSVANSVSGYANSLAVKALPKAGQEDRTSVSTSTSNSLASVPPSSTLNSRSSSTSTSTSTSASAPNSTSTPTPGGGGGTSTPTRTSTSGTSSSQNRKPTRTLVTPVSPAPRSPGRYIPPPPRPPPRHQPLPPTPHTSSSSSSPSSSTQSQVQVQAQSPPPPVAFKPPLLPSSSSAPQAHVSVPTQPPPPPPPPAFSRSLSTSGAIALTSRTVSVQPPPSSRPQPPVSLQRAMSSGVVGTRGPRGAIGGRGVVGTIVSVNAGVSDAGSGTTGPRTRAPSLPVPPPVGGGKALPAVPAPAPAPTPLPQPRPQLPQPLPLSVPQATPQRRIPAELALCEEAHREDEEPAMRDGASGSWSAKVREMSERLGDVSRHAGAPRGTSEEERRGEGGGRGGREGTAPLGQGKRRPLPVPPSATPLSR